MKKNETEIFSLHNQMLEGKINYHRGGRDGSGFEDRDHACHETMCAPPPRMTAGLRGINEPIRYSSSLVRFLYSEGATGLSSHDELNFPRLSKWLKRAAIGAAVAVAIGGVFVLSILLTDRRNSTSARLASSAGSLDKVIWILNPAYFSAQKQLNDDAGPDFENFPERSDPDTLIANAADYSPPMYLPVNSLDEAQTVVNQLEDEMHVIVIKDGRHLDVKRDLAALRDKGIIVEAGHPGLGFIHG